MRRLHDFHGGIHPPERKSLSNTQAIRTAPIPRELILPLAQHIGPPAKAITVPGQKVLGGERLTDLSGLPIHAPTSGTVTALEDRAVPHVSGMPGPCIVIEPDGEDAWTTLQPIGNYRECGRDDLIQRLFEAGIAGLGGAGFPAAKKVPSNDSAQIETLIINGTECEPYITADDMLMRERADAVIAGVEVLRYLSEPKEVLIGIEDNKPEAIAAMRAALGQRTDIDVVVFPTKYPSGGEKQLIEILTGKQVPSGGLPADVGILCQNVGTAVAIRDAVLLGRPLVSRVTTVTGKAAAARGNFEVLLGTPMHDLLAQAEFSPLHGQRLIMGGPMMGVTLPSADSPIVKTTNCLLVPAQGELAEPQAAQACIRCGLCAEACPAMLLPQQLYWYSRSKDYEQLEEHNLFDCIECGACSYVCPSSIPLVQYYRASKAGIREQRAEAAKSDHARERFEARQERLAKAAAEKEARRASRKRAAIAKAADQGGDTDPIQAAIARAKARKAAQAANPPSIADAAAARIAAADKIEARLKKAEATLAADNGEDPAITAALEKAVTATRTKLERAREEAALHASPDA